MGVVAKPAPPGRRSAISAGQGLHFEARSDLTYSCTDAEMSRMKGEREMRALLVTLSIFAINLPVQPAISQILTTNTESTVQRIINTSLYPQSGLRQQERRLNYSPMLAQSDPYNRTCKCDIGGRYECTSVGYCRDVGGRCAGSC